MYNSVLLPFPAVQFCASSLPCCAILCFFPSSSSNSVLLLLSSVQFCASSPLHCASSTLHCVIIGLFSSQCPNVQFCASSSFS
ncbi:hypothetical protein XELAEV_18034831mg [Xenopus laevis]|uniref:Uncharacterized protein n=1 Tax=Xenopus laevis TaxID=8355 RepID=A0A974HBH9_XENLA|nr:hypothetical protein XELAEV_18034831mg [Xenopus laevis]